MADRGLSRVHLEAIEKTIVPADENCGSKIQAAPISTLRVVDTFQDTDQAQVSFAAVNHEKRKNILKVMRTMQQKLVVERRRGSSKYLFLTVLSLLGACVALLLDTVIDKAVAARNQILTLPAWGIVIWVPSLVAGAVLAAACTKYISAAAAGSGVPEMKVVLGGTVLKDALTKRAFIGRYIGLLLAQFANIPVGLEGPFMHLMVVASHHLMKAVPLFRKQLYSYSKSYMDMLLAGLVCGSVANFGTPVAGVIVSIELISTVYYVPNLAKGFYVATMVLLFLKIFRQLFYIASLSDNVYISLFYSDMPSFLFGLDNMGSFCGELAVFFGLGCLCGLLGALLVRTIQTMIQIRLKYLRQYHFTVVAVWAFVNAVIVYYVTFLRGGNKGNTKMFFSATLDEKKWGTPGEWGIIGKLLVWVLYNWFMMGVMFCLPIPCGVFGPLVALGAGLGRLVGELLRVMFGYIQIHPEVYAVVGAAAMTSGLTRTLALAVMVIELTAQMGALLPVLLAVVCSVFIGNWFNCSIFDTIMRLRKLPYLDLTAGREYYAQDVMSPALAVLDVRASLDDLIELLGRHLCNSYLLVERKAPGQPSVLLGSIKREHLLSALQYSVTPGADGRCTPPPSDQKGALDFFAVVYSQSPNSPGKPPKNPPSGTQTPPPVDPMNPDGLRPLGPVSAAGYTAVLPGMRPRGTGADGLMVAAAPELRMPVDPFDAVECALRFDGFSPSQDVDEQNDDDRVALDVARQSPPHHPNSAGAEEPAVASAIPATPPPATTLPPSMSIDPTSLGPSAAAA
eukprot:RCo004462